MEIKTHTRRVPQPPIDITLVVPGARFPKNRAVHIGKPATYDIVQRVETVTDAAGPYERVYYVNSDSGRKGSMPMREFCSGAEHRPPEPIADEPAPDSGVQATTAATIEERIAALDAMTRQVLATQQEILALMRGGAAGPLFSQRAPR
jgi:hypothetical protein